MNKYFNRIKCLTFHRKYHLSSFPMEFSLLQEKDCLKCGLHWDDQMGKLTYYETDDYDGIPVQYSIILKQIRGKI